MYWDGLNTYNLCAQIDDEAVDLVQARFGLNPGVTLQTSPGYLPLSVFNITAVAEEPAQFWFTEVPVDADPERIETPDDLIVPSAFTKDGPEYTFVAALVDMRNPIDEGQVLLLVHGAFLDSGPTIVGATVLPACIAIR